MTGINRREMLKTIGVASLGAVTPQLLKGDVLKVPHKVTEETIHTDILVVGGGTAGVIAAIQAGRAGRSGNGRTAGPTVPSDVSATIIPHLH